MQNVVATTTAGGALVTFSPVDGALDYRIYPLPADGDITRAADGSLTIKNAIYRCGGDRQTASAIINGAPEPQNGPPSTQFDPDPSKNILAYVYPDAAPDRVPIYALAGLASSEFGWRESRPKYYLPDGPERARLLSQSVSAGVMPSGTQNAPDAGAWRDDGIAFYVPATPPADATSIYRSEQCSVVAGQGWTQCTVHYFGAAEMAARASDSPIAPAVGFSALSSAAAGAVPLYRVHYTGGYSGPANHHDELAAGLARFQRAAYQGNAPNWSLHWAGLTAPTTLVVEALDQGCPFQGFLAPQHLDQGYNADGTVDHQAFLTLDEMRQASPTGEVFVNGQHDGGKTLPRAVARSFVRVTPTPTSLDWSSSFSDPSSVAPFTSVPWAKGTHVGDQASVRYQSKDFELDFYALDSEKAKTGSSSWLVDMYGPLLGEFWVAYDDFGHDVTGKMRLTPTTKATVSSDPGSFLRVTMSADIVTTDRRYPQIIVSDLDAPVQDGLGTPDGSTVIVQPIEGPSNRVEVQVFHGLVNAKAWDVNNQSSHFTLADGDGTNPAADPPFEHAAADRSAFFDVYLSTARAYVFLDGAPLGCAELSTEPVPKGAVTVTFGDVLYHEGATDEGVCGDGSVYDFYHTHQCTEAKRHFDDLGFKSGVPAPAWDANRFPCATVKQ